MPMLLHYELSTGTITAVVTSNTLALLEAQEGAPGGPGVATLLLPVDDPVSHLQAQEVQEQWYVVQGEVQQRASLLLTAMPTPFAANGTEVCVVAIAPFVPCTVLVNDTPYPLTEPDPTIEITSTVPAFFAIRLMPLAGYWAESTVAEAI